MRDLHKVKQICAFFDIPKKRRAPVGRPSIYKNRLVETYFFFFFTAVFFLTTFFAFFFAAMIYFPISEVDNIREGTITHPVSLIISKS